MGECSAGGGGGGSGGGGGGHGLQESVADLLLAHVCML